MSLSSPHAWDLVAPGYAAHNLSTFTRLAEQALELLEPEPDHRLLDVATGPGSLACAAASRVARVDALDFSKPMLAALQARTTAASLENVFPVHGDGQALPFGGGTFDCAASMFGLMFFPDRAQGLWELQRVLVPGGRIVIGSWMPMDQVPVFGLMFGTLFELAPELRPSEPPVPPALSTEEALHIELGAAGFDVAVHKTSVIERAPSVADWLEVAPTSFAPLCLAAETLGDRFPLVWEQVVSRLDEAMPGPFELELGAFLTVGTVEP